MGEVKRWECAGEDLPRGCPRGPCVDYADYARLEREHAAAQAELTRLRAVEADREYSAIGVVEVNAGQQCVVWEVAPDEIAQMPVGTRIYAEHFPGGDIGLGSHQHTEQYANENPLAEACGRKGQWAREPFLCLARFVARLRMLGQ